MDRGDFALIARFQDKLQGRSFPDGPVAAAGELYHSSILPHAPAGPEFRAFRPMSDRGRGPFP
jgi:hypothetical protein